MLGALARICRKLHQPRGVLHLEAQWRGDRAQVGDHLAEIDPALADQEPIPDFLFEDKVLDEPEEPEAAAEEADKQNTPEAYDQWLTAKVLLERGRQPETATVVGRNETTRTGTLQSTARHPRIRSRVRRRDGTGHHGERQC
jgi:hypothetical protein